MTEQPMARAKTEKAPTGKTAKRASPLKKASGAEPLPEGTRNALLRRSVLDAAAKLFAERGFGSTNLQDVASALNMSRPSLYYYFSSKEKLLEALLEEVTYAIERQSSEIADKVDLEPEEALRLVIKIHATWLLEHGVQFRVIDRSDNELAPPLRARHEQSKRRILDNLTKVIERGVECGRFRSVDPQVSAFAMIGMCSWTAWWFKPEGRRTSAEVADAIATMAAQSVIRDDTHLRAGSDPLDAIRVLRGDVDYLEQLISRRTD
jgi:AcrR family transcriptional regulator